MSEEVIEVKYPMGALPEHRCTDDECDNFGREARFDPLLDQCVLVEDDWLAASTPYCGTDGTCESCQ